MVPPEEPPPWVMLSYRKAVAESLCSIVAPAIAMTPKDALPMVEERRTTTQVFSVALQRFRRFDKGLDEDALEALGRAAEAAFVAQPDSLASCAFEMLGPTPDRRQPYLTFGVVRSAFLARVLEETWSRGAEIGSLPLHTAADTVVVEYGSPNIAKPFHAGHLRSTIIGNFVRNLYDKMGARTVSLNYLGDWGTQFGLLALGFERFGDEAALRANPIHHLYEVYVRSNREIEVERTAGSEAFLETARAYFCRMEHGDPELLALWARFRALSIGLYREIYARLNTTYDAYVGEHQASQRVDGLMTRLNASGLLETDEKGRRVIDLTRFGLGHAVICKSDGSTLYITRDLAEAIARAETYHFQRMFYVVGAAQAYYFRQLFKVLELLGCDWVDRCVHVTYGAVMGMSTRRGTVVFLDQILDEATEVMHHKMVTEGGTCGLATDEERRAAAQIIGLSTVVVQDLSARRIRDYAFDWKRMTAAEGATGVYLQYTHARLSSMIEKNAGIADDPPAGYSDLLVEDQAYDLAWQIARFTDVLLAAMAAIEPSTLVTYLFDLAHAVSSAITALNVRFAEPHQAAARKRLFAAAKIVLAEGMRVLGLTPLMRM